MNPRTMNRWSLFGLICTVYTVCMLLTMGVDWLSTKKPPNPLYYLIIPAAAMLFSAWLMPKAAIRMNTRLPFQDAVIFCFGIGLFMQLMEPIQKGLYALGIPFPGLIYLTFNYFLAILVGMFALHRWGNIAWWKAFFLGMLNLTLYILGGGLLLALTGISSTLPL